MTSTSSDFSFIEGNLRKHVDHLAGLIGPRTLRKPKMIKATTDYIALQWQEMKYDVSEEYFETSQGTAFNLVTEHAGNRRPSEIVLLGAHYDTVWETPGADDNASAVAVLIEVSRLLRDHVGKRTTRFVAFACEEPPFFHLGEMGSQHHAWQARTTGEKIKAMLCLEMVGYFRDELGSQKVPEAIPPILRRFFPKRGNFLTAVGNLPSWRLAWNFRRGFKRGTKLPLFAIALPELIKEIRFSDNSSFWDQGYPALMLTDTSFLRNPHYHLPSDTPDTLDYARMTQVTLGVASAMRKLLR